MFIKSFNVLKKNGNKLKRCNCAGNHCCKCCRHVIFFPTGMLLRHSCKYCGNGGQSTNEVDNASSLCCQCTLLDRLVDNIIFSICIMYIAILLILISVFWLKWNEQNEMSTHPNPGGDELEYKHGRGRTDLQTILRSNQVFCVFDWFNHCAVIVSVRPIVHWKMTWAVTAGSLG